MKKRRNSRSYFFNSEIMSKSKRSQSGVITTILLMVLVIIAIVIVWNIVLGVLNKSKAQIGTTDMFTTQLEIKQTKFYVTGGAEIQVHRGSGSGNPSALNFIFENKNGERKVIQINQTITPLETGKFYFNVNQIGFNNSDVNKIIVVPIFGDKMGIEFPKEFDSNEKDNNGKLVLYANPTSGIVSWWKFDGNALDSAGGNNGELKNGANTSDNVLNLDGLDDYVDVGNSPTLALNNITISLWIYLKDNGTNVDPQYEDFRYILTKQTGTGYNREYVFDVTDAKFGFWRCNNVACSSPLRTNSALFPQLNSWNHIVVTDNEYEISGRRNMTIFLNGNRIASQKYDLSSYLSNNKVRIGQGTNWQGGQEWNNGTSFKGKMDNVMIFNKSLNLSEIQTIYNNQK